MQNRQAFCSPLELNIGGVTCRLIQVNPELRQPIFEDETRYFQHQHSMLELHYVSEGSCSIAMESGQYQLSAGTLLLIPMNTYHRTLPAPTHCSRMAVTIQIDPPAAGRKDAPAQSFFAALSPAQPKLLKLTPGGPLETVLNTLRAQVYSDLTQFTQREKLRSVGALFLLELYEALATPGPAVSGVPAAPLKYKIDEFFGDYFFLNNGSAQLAKKLNVSTRQLNRIIRQNYGMTYREKLTEIRLVIAMDFLTNTQRSITWISQLLGYNSAAGFSSFIRHATGKTPSQLRAEALRSAPSPGAPGQDADVPRELAVSARKDQERGAP